MSSPIERTYGNGKVKVIIELSDDLWALYNMALEKDVLEYRDGQYDSVEDFVSSLPDELTNSDKQEATERFKRRNEGGTLSDADLLCIAGLLRMDTNAWHLSYKPIKEGEHV